jgi:prepilin-type N-terminal cleavage/methylation domain-containing protein
MRLDRSGYTLIEVLSVIAIVVVLGAVLLPSLRGNRAGKELTSTAQEAATLLREAQGKALSESSSTSWGVLFDNTVSSTPFFVLFSGTATSYATTTSRIILPSRVRYAISSVAVGTSTLITFAQGSGRTATTTSIRFELTEGTTGTATSATVMVNSFGAVSF